MYILCYPGTKKPMGNNWAEHSLSPEEISRRLANNPDNNVGLLLGLKSGYIDLECDSPEAEASLQDLVGPTLEHCPAWISTRGTHNLFAYDPRLASLPAVVKLRGIEFRLGNGKAAQSIIPPSIVDGVQRTWIRSLDDYPPLPLPEHVIELLLATTTKPERPSYDPLFADVHRELQQATVAKLLAWCARAKLPTTLRGGQANQKIIDFSWCPHRGPGHTDGGAAIIINVDGTWYFHCFHAKCSKVAFADLEAIHGPLHLVVRLGTDLDRIVSEATRALSRYDGVYQRGGLLVQVTRDAPLPKLCLHDNGSAKLAPLAPAALMPLLTTCAQWEKRDAKKWKRCLPPANVVAALDASTHYPGVPVVTGIVTSPVLRADGSILAEPGYDDSTGLFADLARSFPPLMSTDEAVAQLLDVLADFPFATPAHRAGWIAYLVTLVARHAFAGPAPLFLFDANASRAGKGLLTDVAAMIVEGRKASRYTQPTDDSETRKVITSAALAGASYVLFDNVKGKLGGAALEAGMTTGRWSDRLLGGNKQIDLALNWVWAATANNCQLSQDMVGRTLHIRLETPEERPELRSGFKYSDLLDYVKTNRAALAIAALSIPARYIAAGRPAQDLPAWGGFEGWSNLVRASLVWAGLPDPGETRAALAEQADDESATLRQLMDGWAQLGFPASVTTALECIATSDKYPLLHEAVAELQGDRKHALGNVLKRFRGRVLGGRCFDRTAHKIPRWELRPA